MAKLSDSELDWVVGCLSTLAYEGVRAGLIVAYLAGRVLFWSFGYNEEHDGRIVPWFR